MSDTGKAFVPESQDDDDASKEIRQHYKDGAAVVETSLGSTNAYGPKVEFIKYPFSSGSTTLAAVLTLANISSYHKGAFTISGLTGETIAITGNFEAGASGALTVRQGTDGAVISAATLGNGTYYFSGETPLIFDSVDFTKSATSETVTIIGHLMP